MPQIVIGYKGSLGLYQAILLTNKENQQSWFDNHLINWKPDDFSDIAGDDVGMVASTASWNHSQKRMFYNNKIVWINGGPYNYDDLLRDILRRPVDTSKGDVVGYLHVPSPTDEGYIWIKNISLFRTPQKSAWRVL